MAFRKPCVICGALSRGSRCEQHQKELDQRKQAAKNSDPNYRAKKSALYGYAHQQARRQVIANAIVCHICSKPFTYGERIDADHLIAGDPHSPLLPAHPSCNRSRGSKPIE